MLKHERSFKPVGILSGYILVDNGDASRFFPLGIWKLAEIIIWAYGKLAV
jgi:hypothetical protein|tara:strand:+ start:768 stop:917 length:150 start_codon:yes stop_codon:yes gene_type:complete